MASKSSTSNLLSAVDEGDLLAVQRLLKTPGVCVSGTNKHGESPLHVAAGYGRLNIVSLLLENGATIDLKDKQGDSPLYWAARHGHVDVVQYLCEQGATVDIQDTAGETAVHVSARYGHPQVLSFLCQAGAHLDIRDKDGDTPLLCGCWHGYQRVVECLVSAGCSISSKNNDQESPLHVAAVRGYYSIVRLLCENGAVLDEPDKDGRSALHLSARRNHLNIVQYLCERGCIVNMQDHNGDTALHEVSREGQLSTFQVLYAAKCNLNIPNRNGATPLHLAAKYGHTEFVRQLVMGGCDVNVVTEHGFQADEVAANYSHHPLATLLHKLKQSGVQDYCRHELKIGKSPRSRAKLLVCGAAGVGKTELIDSLKCGRLQSLFRRRSASDLRHMIFKRTYGMSVQQVSLPNTGDFSVWDFSGLKDYYITHELFLGAANAVTVLLFSLRDSLQKQLAQVRFWLAMIKSRQAPSHLIQFAGRHLHKPHVVLVGSFSDQQRTMSELETESDVFAAPSASSILQPEGRQSPTSNSAQVLDKLLEEFGDHFEFEEMTYCVDCRLPQSRDVRLLRERLGVLRLQILQYQHPSPLLVNTLTDILPSWRSEHVDLPALSWEAFLDKTRECVNPLVTEDILRAVTTALHVTGEVVYISDESLCNIVVLDPNWLGLQIFGPALSPENSIIPQLKSITGRVSISQLQRVYPNMNSSSVANLFEHFQLALPQDESRSTFLFPCLIKMEPLFGLWEKDSSFAVYAGVHIKCKSSTDLFSPGLFPRVQITLRRAFSDDIDDQEVILWSDGLKCCRGEVEVLLTHKEPHKIIQILVRGADDTRVECFSLLQQFHSTVVESIRSSNPGTNFSTYILSSTQLSQHTRDPVSYSPVEIYQAEREGGILCHPSIPSLQETILDLVCCGCEDLLMRAKSAPYAVLQDLPTLTRAKLSQMLDLPESYGRDWCLLALQLGLTDEVPSIHQAEDGVSPTDRLLRAWDRGSSDTLVSIVDALRGIGRDDAACVLIEGLSPFRNANHSVVINLHGAALTSYVC